MDCTDNGNRAWGCWWGIGGCKVSLGYLHWEAQQGDQQERQAVSGGEPKVCDMTWSLDSDCDNIIVQPSGSSEPYCGGQGACWAVLQVRMGCNRYRHEFNLTCFRIWILNVELNSRTYLMSSIQKMCSWVCHKTMSLRSNSWGTLVIYILFTGVTQKARRPCLFCCTVMLLLLVSCEICIIPVFICLDWPGQGIVYETMGMSELPDYSTKVIIMVWRINQVKYIFFLHEQNVSSDVDIPW